MNDKELQKAIADFSEMLKQSAEKMKNEERKHEQYKKEYGEFIGNILYLNDLKGV